MIYIQWQNHQGYGFITVQRTMNQLHTEWQQQEQNVKKRHRLLDANKKVIDIVEY